MFRRLPCLLTLALAGVTLPALVAPAASATTVAHPAPPAAISAGAHSTLAVTPAGTVRAWGDNSAGQLGNGTRTTPSGPVTVLAHSGTGPLTHVVTVASGQDFSVAVRADGTVWTWGDNDDGQLGNGSTTSTTRPVEVVGTSGHGALTGVVSVSAGRSHVLALLGDGTVVAWGYNFDDELGNGSLTNSSVPVHTVALSGHGRLGSVTAVSAGAYASYALLADNTVAAWGQGTYGELGVDGEPTSASPVLVETASGTPLHGIVQISGGTYFATALVANGTVVAWGDNADGQLGNSGTANSSRALTVPGLGSVAAIGSGFARTQYVVVADDGSLTLFGDGQPPATGAFAGFGLLALTSGADFIVTLDRSGAVIADGATEDHQLGNGPYDDPNRFNVTRPADLGTVGLPRLVVLHAPVLGGRVGVGHALSVTHGTWGLPATSYRYQWYRGSAAIRGATGSRYTPAAADRRHRVSVRVTASRPGYPAGSVTTRSVAVPG